MLRARGVGRKAQQRQCILDHSLIALARAIPFQHGEFGRMQRTALAIAEDAGEIEDFRFARCQQLLGREFRRGVQIKRAAAAVGPDSIGRKGMQMGLIARGDGQSAAFDLGKALGLEMRTQHGLYPPARQQGRAAVGMPVRRPPRRSSGWPRPMLLL